MKDLIVKNCSHHGPLTRDQVNITSKKGYFKCKACQKILRKNHYEANKEKVRAAQLAYKEKDVEAYKEKKRISSRKFWKKYKLQRIEQRKRHYNKNRKHELRRCSAYKKHQATLLSDVYIKNLIARSTKRTISTSDVTPEMIVLKRVILEIQRRYRKQILEIPAL